MKSDAYIQNQNQIDFVSYLQKIPKTKNKIQNKNKLQKK